MSFTHLHVHTEYSLLDGASRIKALISRCKELGMDHIAITDHGVMYGVVDFYKEAKAAGIHPIIGCEVYITEGKMGDITNRGRESSHLVLLCKNNTGYQNLIKLVSLGFTDGFYYKPRIDYDTLAGYSEGLICLSACLAGDIPRYLLDGRYLSAKNLALRLKGIFGEDFYLEVQDHGIPEQRKVNPDIKRLSEETGIPLVATNDVHYTNASDAKAHEVLLCVQTQTTMDDPDRMQFGSDEFYLKSPEEMLERFSWCPEAISNTVKIAERCDMQFDFSTTHLPAFHIPEGYDSHEDYLRSLCLEGLPQRYDEVTHELHERLDYELDIINRMGYTDYFLIVWDFVHYARSHEIEVGPGRGSGAASLASYCLGITAVDPIKYNLPFERFLNPERVSMPDFDIDFCYVRRQEVIDYVIEKYGEDHVAQIITFGTMAARAAIRDCGRALGMSYGEVDQIAKMIPMQIGMTIEHALEMNPQLKEIYSDDDRVQTLVDTALALEGLPRHASTHAAGVVITKDPVTDYVPLNRNGDIITTQFPMGTIEELGLLKMDFLGLRTLTVIRDAVDMVKARGRKLDIRVLQFDDEKVYKIIASGDTDGIFQLESAGMRAFLKELKPEHFEEIIAAISLYRPGPMDFIPKYIEGKKHPETVKYDHPILEKSLSVTYGCMVYQEQVMQVVRDMAGYSLGRSDLVRRAMAKKKHKVMVEERKNFIYGLEKDGEVIIDGAIRRGVPEQVANKIFDDMMDFSNYAFNKPHAAAYAVVAYRTAWLKVYYPVEFMAALMNSFMGNAKKIASYIHYCRKKGIEVLSPDINKSGVQFGVEDKNIRFGLAAVRNVGSSVVKEIIKIRQGGDFVDIFDFCERCSEFINKRMVESLIKAGAFDSTGAYRSQMMAVYEQAIDGAQRAKRGNVTGQVSLFEVAGDEVIPRPQLPRIAELKNRVMLAMEKEMTGVYIQGHPLAEYKDELEAMEYNSTMFGEGEDDESGHGQEAEIRDGQIVTLAGIVVAKQVKATKKNDMMCFITLEDLYGTVEVIVFPRQMKQSFAYLEVDAIIMVAGRVSHREGEAAKLVAESIQPFKGKQQVGKLYLKIGKDKPSFIMEVAMAALENHTGTSPVYIYDEAKGKKYILNRRYWVTINTELIATLKEALGDENVKTS